MSKSILSIGLTIIGIALIATGIGAPLGAIAIAGATISVASIIGMGLLIAASVLLGPSVPKVPGSLANGGRDRLYATLDVKTPRKILFGNTAGATDVRYQTFTGTEQEYMEMIVCVASHKVNSIYELWLDNEQVWTLAGGAQGDFVGYATITPILEGTNANGIAIDTVWTSTCTLTGCAYFRAVFKLTGPDDQTPGPFSGGVSQRMTVRCKGGYVYDPRLDSTVTGGSGSHRAATQSTWAWSDTGSRNPALQLLWFLLGWKINSKLAAGMGLPAARIDLPSFITAANICDESVTKSAANGGGTEPRYRCDGVLSESDDRQAVVEALCASMNAIVRDNGGKLSLTVLKNDLGTPVASFADKDVIGALEFDQTPDLAATFNITRGQRIDPSDTALYQPVDYTEVSLTSIDGIDRIDSFDLPMVQSHGQAIRLAKQRLQRNQYQARLRLTGKPSWWQVNIGEVIQLSHQAYGWTNKLFRVAGQQISRTGATEVVMVEENAAIYQWDNDEAAPVTPGAPTIYDSSNSPILKGIAAVGAPTTGNMLTDTLFSTKWTKTAGAFRFLANALSGYAKGSEKWYLELDPSTSLVRSGLSEKVPVNPGQKYFFSFKAQRGTTLGSGSRLNAGGQWLGSDGVTVVGSFTEGTQQTPSTLTAGALPQEVSWSGTAPATAYFVQIKPYTPALASSSGSFRVEKPWVSIVDAGGAPSIGYGPAAASADYAADGTAQTGELPFDLTYQMYLGAVAQTAGVAWTYTVLTGGINSKTNANGAQSISGTGAGVLTVTTLDQDTSTVKLTATAANGSIATFVVTLTKVYAAGTGVVGGGGSSGDSPAQTSGFTSINSTTFVAISNVLTYTVPTGQTTVTNTVSLQFKPGLTGGNGSWTVEMKVMRLISGVWTAQGSTFSGGTDVYTDGEGFPARDNVTLSGTRQSTGLTAGVQYSERIDARLTSGTRSHSVTGSVSLASP